MIAILKSWRQFGKRYFCSPILLGVITAALGLPSSFAGVIDTPSNVRSINQPRDVAATLEQLTLVKRPNANINYWQQHAVRVVIRHLSFTLAGPAYQQPSLDQTTLDEPALLLTQLHLLLTQPTSLQDVVQPLLSKNEDIDSHHSGLWLAQVSGIRAGPLFLI